MTKKSDKQLQDMLHAADRHCPIGSVMQHEKSGGVYRVMSIELREEDLEPLVVYRREDSPVAFARPLEEFLERFEFKPRPRSEK